MTDRPSYSRRQDFPRLRGRHVGFAIVPLVLLLLAPPSGCDQEPAVGGDAAARSDLAPERIAAALEAAEHYFRGGDLESAETILSALVEREPDTLDARELYGQVLLRRATRLREAGRSDESTETLFRAYEQYQNAVQLRPDSAGLHQSAGEIAQMAGRSSAALRHYLAAAMLSPLAAKHRLYAAQIQLEQGDFEAASASLKRVLELDPDEPFAFASLASLAVESGENVRARAMIATARRLDPDNDDLRLLEARILRRTGQPDDALEVLLAMPPEQRTTIAYTREIAAAHARRGHHERAARAWQRCHDASTRDADRAEAALEAAHAWSRAGDRAEAAVWLRRARMSGADGAAIRRVEAELAADGGG